MLIDISSPVYNTILFYLITIIIILVMKPSFMYSETAHKFKSFGCGPDQTILSFPLISICLTVFYYVIFLVVEILSRKL